jgi:hypothetical protein
MKLAYRDNSRPHTWARLLGACLGTLLLGAHARAGRGVSIHPASHAERRLLQADSSAGLSATYYGSGAVDELVEQAEVLRLVYTQTDTQPVIEVSSITAGEQAIVHTSVDSDASPGGAPHPDCIGLVLVLGISHAEVLSECG